MPSKKKTKKIARGSSHGGNGAGGVAVGSSKGKQLERGEKHLTKKLKPSSDEIGSRASSTTTPATTVLSAELIAQLSGSSKSMFHDHLAVEEAENGKVSSSVPGAPTSQKRKLDNVNNNETERIESSGSSSLRKDIPITTDCTLSITREADHHASGKGGDLLHNQLIASGDADATNVATTTATAAAEASSKKGKKKRGEDNEQVRQLAKELSKKKVKRMTQIARRKDREARQGEFIEKIQSHGLSEQHQLLLASTRSIGQTQTYKQLVSNLLQKYRAGVVLTETEKEVLFPTKAAKFGSFGDDDPFDSYVLGPSMQSADPEDSLSSENEREAPSYPSNGSMGVSGQGGGSSSGKTDTKAGEKTETEVEEAPTKPAVLFSLFDDPNIIPLSNGASATEKTTKKQRKKKNRSLDADAAEREGKQSGIGSNLLSQLSGLKSRKSSVSDVLGVAEKGKGREEENMNEEEKHEIGQKYVPQNVLHLENVWQTLGATLLPPERLQEHVLSTEDPPSLPITATATPGGGGGVGGVGGSVSKNTMEQPSILSEENAPTVATAGKAQPTAVVVVAGKEAKIGMKAGMEEGKKSRNVVRAEDVMNRRMHLPISAMEQEILEAVRDNDVIILAGETGSGKSTQVPQFLYEAGYSRDGSMIGITQPRRVAVTSTAVRVAEEMRDCDIVLSRPEGTSGVKNAQKMQTESRKAKSRGKKSKNTVSDDDPVTKPSQMIGKASIVGYQIRYDASTMSAHTRVKYMTDGILLQEMTKHDFLLRRYSVIVLDESHERNINTDVLLGLLSRMMPVRRKIAQIEAESLEKSSDLSHPQPSLQPLKLIIMSATLRVSDFQNPRLFRPLSTGTLPTPSQQPQSYPPVITVESRQYPVTTHFARRTELRNYLQAAHKKVVQIHRKLPPGGILVFLTGKREILYMCKKLRHTLNGKKGGSATASLFRGRGGGEGGGIDNSNQSGVKTPSNSSNSTSTLQVGGVELVEGGDQVEEGEGEGEGGIDDDQSEIDSDFEENEDLASEDEDEDANSRNSSNSLSDIEDDPQNKKGDETALLRSRSKINEDDAALRGSKKRARVEDDSSTSESDSESERAGASLGKNNNMLVDDDVSNEGEEVATNAREDERALPRLQGKDCRKSDLQNGKNLAEKEEETEEEKEEENGEESSLRAKMLKEVLGFSSATEIAADKPALNPTNTQQQSFSKPTHEQIPTPEIGDRQVASFTPECGISDNSQAEETGGFGYKGALVLPLYAMLSASEQARIFRPGSEYEGYRLIVVATNVAETSITIPGIRYVVDTGRQKEKVYRDVQGESSAFGDRNRPAPNTVVINRGSSALGTNNTNGTTAAAVVSSVGEGGGGTGGGIIASYEVTWVSQASAEQRKGRAGRTGPGHVYRLYSAAFYDRHLRPFQPPQITATPLEDLILQMKALGIEHVERFPFPTAPPAAALKRALILLQHLGAITRQNNNSSTMNISSTKSPESDGGKLTPLGRELSKFPLSPRFAKILLYAHVYGVLPHALTLVAALAERSVFTGRGFDNKLAKSSRKRTKRIRFGIADDESTGSFSSEDDDGEEEDEEEAEDENHLQNLKRKFLFYHPDGDALATMKAIGAYMFTAYYYTPPGLPVPTAGRSANTRDHHQQTSSKKSKQQNAEVAALRKRELRDLCSAQQLHMPTILRVLELRRQLQQICGSTALSNLVQSSASAVAENPVETREMDEKSGDEGGLFLKEDGEDVDDTPESAAAEEVSSKRSSPFSSSSSSPSPSSFLTHTLAPPRSPPSTEQELILRKLLVTGFADCIAKRVPPSALSTYTLAAQQEAYVGSKEKRNKSALYLRNSSSVGKNTFKNSNTGATRTGEVPKLTRRKRLTAYVSCHPDPALRGQLLYIHPHSNLYPRNVTSPAEIAQILPEFVIYGALVRSSAQSRSSGRSVGDGGEGDGRDQQAIDLSRGINADGRGGGGVGYGDTVYMSGVTAIEGAWISEFLAPSPHGCPLDVAASTATMTTDSVALRTKKGGMNNDDERKLVAIEMRRQKGLAVYSQRLAKLLFFCPSSIQNCPLLRFSAPLSSPSPYYDVKFDDVMCYTIPKYGHQNWELAPVRRPLLELTCARVFYAKQVKAQKTALLEENEECVFSQNGENTTGGVLGYRHVDEAFRWFARLLLEGAVPLAVQLDSLLPNVTHSDKIKDVEPGNEKEERVKVKVKFRKDRLREMPSTITQLKPDAKITALLRGLITHTVCCRKSLLAQLRIDPSYLREELAALMKVEFREDFRKKWSKLGAVVSQSSTY